MRFPPIKLPLAYALLSAPYLWLGIWLLRHDGLACTAGYFIADGLIVASLWFAVARPRPFLWLNLPMFVLGMAFAIFTLIQDTLPSYPIAFVLLTSSLEEAIGFFSVWENQRLLLGLLGIVTIYVYLAFCAPARPRKRHVDPRWRWAAIGVFAAATGVAAGDPGRFIEGVADSPLIGTIAFVAGPLSAARQTIEGAYRTKVPYAAARVRDAEVHIVVIGESSRRASWGIYGYSRPTTPYLESIRSETVFFDAATADGNATAFAVPILMTGIGPEELHIRYIQGNLVDLAKEAGYFTSWLVNNDASVSYLMGMKADKAVYPHSTTTSIARTSPPDGLLLPEFARQLARTDERKFIGLHLFGSHFSYANRYPPSFARWGARGTSIATGYSGQALIDGYDNSILYTDWFLQQVIEAARRLEVPATVTYVADHGEELPSLDGRSGHGFTTYTAKSFDIPAFIWMNAAYRNAHPDKVEGLIANEHKLVRSHDFFYTLADIMGIRWPGYFAERSFASRSFAVDARSRYLAGGVLVARTD